MLFVSNKRLLNTAGPISVSRKTAVKNIRHTITVPRNLAILHEIESIADRGVRRNTINIIDLMVDIKIITSGQNTKKALLAVTNLSESNT